MSENDRIFLQVEVNILKKHNPNHVDLVEKPKPEAETHSEEKGKMKFGLSEILGALLAFVISWLLSTAVWQSGLDQTVSVAINVMEGLFPALGIVGIAQIAKIKDKYKTMAVLVACGCGLGVILGFCTYTYGHIEIGPRNSPPPPSTQETASVILTDAPSKTTPPTDSPPVEATPNKESEDKTITIDIPVGPITVTEAPDSDELIDKDILGDFCALICFNDEMLPPSAKNKGYWKEKLKIAIWSLANTDVHPDSNLVNNDTDHTQKTEGANDLAVDMKEKGYSKETNLKIIRLREDAFKLHKTAGLRFLLASDYAMLADEYKKEELWEEAYDKYLKAAEYKLLQIRLMSNPNDSFYSCLYDLCDWYHKIGDMDGLNTESKKEAYYLSVCLAEIAAANLSDNSYLQPYSISCAGTVNHKLFRLNKKRPAVEWTIYFNDACQYYLDSLSFDLNHNDTYNALKTLYEWGGNYTAHRKVDGLLTSAEYAELKKEIKAKK